MDISTEDYQITSSKLIKRATYFAVTSAAICIIAKVFALFLTGSLALLASLFDSVLDIAASLVNVVAIHYALQPPDNEHRFGHGKAEDLAVLTQSIFFSITGLLILCTSIKKLFSVEPIEDGLIGIYLMIFSITLNIALVTYQRHVIRITQSSIIKADHLHYVIDLATNSATILALVLATFFKLPIADPILAILISGYIMYGSWKLMSGAFDNLMDRELSDVDKEVIKKIIVNYDRVIDFHDLKTRYSGNKPFIQFHIVLAPTMQLLEVHGIVEGLEAKILEKMPKAEIIIHQDPDGIDEEIRYQD